MKYVLDSDAVAAAAKVTPDRVQQAARAGYIGKKFGRSWLFSEEDVAELIARKGAGRKFGSKNRRKVDGTSLGKGGAK